jgi:predicted dehydrogenase
VITMRHANGAISSIVYVAGGDPSLAKERIEVFGGGRAAVLDDNARLDLHADGRRRTTRWRRDVGHAAQLAAFARAVRGLAPWPVAWTELRAVTLAALAAVESAREGAAIEI